MIGSLRGTLVLRDEDEVTLEVAGIGYRVAVTPTTSAGLGKLGEEAVVYTHHHFREDAQTLYGFSTPAERHTFEMLIAAHGVGPALGLAILSVHGPAELASILASDDIGALCLVPGIGKKTATRLLVELKDRLDIGDVATAVNADGPPDGSTGARSEVRQALAELGYGAEEIRDALRSLPDGDDPSHLLKTALQQLASRT